MSDVFRRAGGRGGAGNFISQNDVNAAQPNEDLEAQKLPAQAQAPVQQQPQPYARVGRGGAGNFHDSANLPEESREEVAERTGTAVAAPSARRSGLTGRGGVGNWSDSATAPQDPDARKKEELANKVVRNVDAELPMPPKIYTSPLKEEA
ncbi:uncharacterized protein DNG_03269 [Cephalotrichum gorgonifer]|uniref:Uncharacterized protein n=1 Tax=Cephalotrichum gorgonifer TaxID=2041049 RepID=A0AAE8STU4_9PEZI|nr:uncharacterized protein DNG_03269 [Cephalotrichum gorgonifer]